MGKVPNNIATFLNLPEPELYTGHCFRRSSATQLANQGGDLLTIKRHGGWKSSAVAESYVEASVKKKIEVSQMLASKQTDLNLPGCSTIPQQRPGCGIIRNISVTGNSNVRQDIGQDIASDQHLYGVTINSQDTSHVTVNVYNNCTFHGHNLD